MLWQIIILYNNNNSRFKNAEKMKAMHWSVSFIAQSKDSVL